MNYKLRSLIAATLTGSVLMGFGANAMADSTDDILNALIAKGVLTEEEGALLMKGREGEKEAAAKKKETAVSAKFKDGLSFESGDGTFKASINGRVQEDYRAYDYSNAANNTAPKAASVKNSTGNVNNIADTFDTRRARIGFKAQYKEFYEAELSANIVGNNSSTSNTTALDQAWLNVAWWKPVQFKFGQFKMPMNLEELTSSNNIDFLERSFVNQLAPKIDTGAQVHGLPTTGVTYAVAVANGSGQNANDTDMRADGKDVIARGTINFAEIMENKDMILHAGLSYSDGVEPNTAPGTATPATIGVNGQTEAKGARFFTAPTLATASPYQNIDRTRTGVEGIVAYNQFKFQSEYLQASNDFDTKTENYSLDTNNWYAEAMWLISGEKYADFYKNGAMGAIKPAKDFNPTDFSGGVWEVGFRVSEFDASDYNADGVGKGEGTADTGFAAQASGFAKAKGYTAGVKFYPNANMRFMLNYIQTDFSDAIGGTTGGIIVNQKRVDDEKAITMRAQWMF